jgi:hypothetical protein
MLIYCVKASSAVAVILATKNTHFFLTTNFSIQISTNYLFYFLLSLNIIFK